MKKILFVFTVAAVALTACTNESTEYVGSGPEAKEIAFSPLTQPTTRAAVEGTTFPTTITNMYVSAYDASNNRPFFDATTFTYASAKAVVSGATTYQVWAGGKYWPFNPVTINFLAYTELNSTSGSSATWGATGDSPLPNAAKVTLVMADNSTAQNDLMYAIGTGAVTESSTSLTFPTKVDMQFKHAQALIAFTVKSSDPVGSAITINSIKLTGAKYGGTFTVTHNNYNSPTVARTATGVWSALSAASSDPVIVPGWTASALSTTETAVGNGLMIVPDETDSGDFTSFTINYTLDEKTYDFTYTPTSTNVAKGSKYIYNIVFTLHEILVAPTVENWGSTTATAVNIGS